MTSENHSKLSDASSHAHKQTPEPTAEQALFIEKLRGAAKSATDKFSKVGTSSGLDELKVEKSSAVQDILRGFSLEGVDKA